MENVLSEFQSAVSVSGCFRINFKGETETAKLNGSLHLSMKFFSLNIFLLRRRSIGGNCELYMMSNAMICILRHLLSIVVEIVKFQAELVWSMTYQMYCLYSNVLVAFCQPNVAESVNT